MSFGHFSLPKIAPLFPPPPLNAAEFTFSVAKNVAFFETIPILRKIRTLRFAAVKWRDRGSKHRNKRQNMHLT